MPPLIGITASLAAEPRERVQLNASYVRAVENAGGVPILVPAQASFSSLAALVGMVDGLVLTGGGDVNPARYGEERHPTVAGVSDERDAAEEAVLNLALDRGVPVLAICRGMQILNVALGGSLVQDIPAEPGGGIVHGPRAEHVVNIAPRSKLAEVISAETAQVNSRHHQAVNTLGKGLKPVAWSADGAIEGVEMPGKWVIGVQWHPEDMVEDSEVARRLFAGVVEAAASR